MNTVRTLLATALAAGALAATTLAVASQAAAQRAPLDPPPDTSTSAPRYLSGGRTDQQFWGEATWLNPLSGLNLDRTSVAG